MAIKSLAKERESLTVEVDRLNKARELVKATSIANLPADCLTDLTSSQRMKEVSQCALESALTDLKKADKGRDDLVQQIEELEQKQRRAYLRLYDRVG